MAKILTESGVNSEKVLTLDAFRPYIGFENEQLQPSRMKPIVAVAERMLDEEIPMLPVHLYTEYQTNGNRARFETPYFYRRNMAVNLAAAEMYERQGRFTMKLADVLFAILEESTWVISAHDKNNPIHSYELIPPVFGDRVHGVDLFSADTAAILAMARYYLKAELDEISPVICERIDYQIRKRVALPFRDHAHWWSGDIDRRPNNWNPWIISNVLYAIALTEREMTMRKTIVSLAIRYLDNFSACYEPDGGCDEGPSYWGRAGASFFDACEVLYDMTGGDADTFSHPLLCAMGEYITKVHIDKDRFVNFADGKSKTNPGGAFLRRFGERVGSEAMYSLGDTLELIEPIKSISQGGVYRSIRNLMSPSVSHAPSAAMTKCYLPNLKVMVRREYNDTAKGFFLAIKGGHNAESHNHNDIGHFVVYHDGAPVLIDPGASTYTKDTFSDKRYTIPTMTSSWHSVADIGAYTQLPGKQYCSSEECYDEESGCISMELRNAYPHEAGILSYRRHASLDTGVEITDSIRMASPTKIDLHYIMLEKPTLLSDGEVALPNGCVMRYPSSLTASVDSVDMQDDKFVLDFGTCVFYRLHLTATVTEGSFTIRIDKK